MIVVDEIGCIAKVHTWPAIAAHSMDTDWYGVDSDGNVAMLASGENGAVPYAAHRQYWERLFQDLVVIRIVTSAPLALQRALAAASDPVERAIITAILGGDEASRDIYTDYLEQHGRTPARPVFAVERELRAIDPDALPHEWDGILQFATREYLELYRAEYHYDEWRTLEGLDLPTGAIGQRIQKWAFDDYWNAGAITAVYVIDQPIEPHLVGLYEYGCSYRGPYERRAVPAEPLLVDVLPEALREDIGRLRIPVRFASTEDFDPATWFDCQTWD